MIHIIMKRERNSRKRTKNINCLMRFWNNGNRSHNQCIRAASEMAYAYRYLINFSIGSLIWIIDNLIILTFIFIGSATFTIIKCFFHAFNAYRSAFDFSFKYKYTLQLPYLWSYTNNVIDTIHLWYAPSV